MRYWARVQWNQRMRNTRRASPCVTSTRLVLLANLQMMDGMDRSSME